MNIAARLTTIMAVLAALGACGGASTPGVNAAEMVESDAAADAARLEDLAANTANQVLADQLENQADAIEANAENRANAIAAQNQPPADLDEDDND